jgi:hypothetical protein
VGSIGIFFLQLLDDVPWEHSYQSVKKGERRTRLGSLKSSHLFTNGARDRGRRWLSGLLKTVREWRITMRLFAHGFELCLATLKALPQLCSSIYLFGEFNF